MECLSLTEEDLKNEEFKKILFAGLAILANFSEEEKNL